MLIKEYKFTNFATALTNIVLAQIAILSFTVDEDMSVYNSFLGGLVGIVILGFGVYFIINGLIKYRKYKKSIASSPLHAVENNELLDEKKD